MTDRLHNEDLETIRKTPVFSALAPHALREFLRHCPLQTLAGGQTILRPGQKADRFFVILAGQVKLFKLSAGGDEQTLHLYGPGETFGEAAMWARMEFPAHAEAIGPVRLLVVQRENLRDAIASNVDLAMGMLAGLSGKLREFNLLIEQLSLKGVPARLATALLDQARKCGSKRFRLTQTKRELAGRLGTAAETLSRALAKMKNQGLIRVAGSEITILDSEGLEDLAQG